MLNKGVCSSFATVILIIVFFSSFTPTIGTNNMEFFAGNDPYGKPLQDWAKEYWQWIMALPAGEIPKDSQTNLAKCIMGSNPEGNVTFLFGAYDETYVAKCNISSKQPILVPILTGECDSTVPEQRAKTGKIEDLWACARDADVGLISWEVTLDNRILFKKAGNEEVNLNLIDQILVRNSSLFNITIPEVNRFEVDPGVYPAVVDGYYLMLNPLPLGEHTLKYKATQEQKIPGADLSYINSDATYFFTVN